MEKRIFKYLILLFVVFQTYLIIATIANAEKITRPITAWPLVYYRGNMEYANTDVIWPIFRYERKNTWQRFAIRPLIFAIQKDTKYCKSNFLWPLTGYERYGYKDLSLYVFPVYWYKKSISKKYNIIFPFYWKGSSFNDSYFHIWPLFGKSSTDILTQYSTLHPFFKYSLNKASNEKNFDVLWPLGKIRIANNLNSLRLFPLFSIKNDMTKDSHHTNILLILSDYWRSQKGYSFHIFPVYWRGSKYGHSYFHLWPFFGINQKQTNTEYSTLYPFFRYSYDSSTKKTQWNALWPLIKYKKSNDSIYFRFFPLLYFSHGKLNKTDWVFPFYYNKQDGDNKLQMITPLYISRQSLTNRFKVFLPLYLDYKEQDLRLKVGFPVYFSFHKGPLSFNSFVPLYFSSEDKNLQKSFVYYFPLYGYYKRGNYISKHFLLFPLYSSFIDVNRKLKAWDIVWPLVHYESTPKTQSIRALPFYLHSSTETYDFSALMPLYWSYSSTAIRYLHIFPIYSKLQKEDWYIKKFILGPGYISTINTKEDIKNLDILFPFFSMRTQKDTLRSWMMPFYHHWRNSVEKTTVGSVFLLPPYLYQHVSASKRIFHLWPFYGTYRDGNYKENTIAWPLFRVGRNKINDYYKLHLLLYYYNKNKLDTYITLFPIWWHQNKQQQKSDKTLLLYSYENQLNKKSLQLLWFFTPNLSVASFKKETDKYAKNYIFPLYYFNRDKTNKNFRAIWFFSPKLALFNYKDNEYETKHSLFPLYSYKYGNKKNTASRVKEFRILWRLVRYYKTSEHHFFEFNPLYFYEEKQGEGSYWSILGGLFGVETNIDKRKKHRLFWIF